MHMQERSTKSAYLDTAAPDQQKEASSEYNYSIEVATVT